MEAVKKRWLECRTSIHHVHRIAFPVNFFESPQVGLESPPTCRNCCSIVRLPNTVNQPNPNDLFPFGCLYQGSQNGGGGGSRTRVPDGFKHGVYTLSTPVSGLSNDGAGAPLSPILVSLLASGNVAKGMKVLPLFRRPASLAGVGLHGRRGLYAARSSWLAPGNSITLF